MRIRKDGTRYLQDRRPQDAPPDRQRLPPRALATSSTNNAIISLEIAAGCLKRLEKSGAWASVFTALESLKEAQAAMGKKYEMR